MAKKELTFRESLEARGLLLLAQAAYRKALKDYMPLLAEVLGEEAEDDGSEYQYFGHVSDAIYTDYTFDELLTKLGTKVLPIEPRAKTATRAEKSA